MLVLLDQNAPYGLRTSLPGHEVKTSFSMGWDQLSNGDLLNAAELAGFAAMVTCDQNIRYQQNMANRQIALIVLSSNNWKVIRAHLASVQAAVAQAGAGSFRNVTFERPPLVRRKPGDDTTQ